MSGRTTPRLRSCVANTSRTCSGHARLSGSSPSTIWTHQRIAQGKVVYVVVHAVVHVVVHEVVRMLCMRWCVCCVCGGACMLRHLTNYTYGITTNPEPHRHPYPHPHSRLKANPNSNPNPDGPNPNLTYL